MCVSLSQCGVLQVMWWSDRHSITLTSKQRKCFKKHCLCRLSNRGCNGRRKSKEGSQKFFSHTESLLDTALTHKHEVILTKRKKKKFTVMENKGLVFKSEHLSRGPRSLGLPKSSVLLCIIMWWFDLGIWEYALLKSNITDMIRAFGWALLY